VFYRRKVSEGKTEKQALKLVSRRLVNILYGIMKHGSDYINPPTVYIDPETGEIIGGDKLNDNQITHELKKQATFKDAIVS